MKTTHLSGLLTTAGLVFGGGNSYAQQRPNILWLTIEDTSPYDFGCYGNRHVATPTIDSLAGAGIQYMRAHSVGTQSSPSRSCIITGCYASTFGMEWHRCRFATPETVFLPDYMRAAGYYCTNKSKTDYNTLCDNKAMWDSCGPAATTTRRGRRTSRFLPYSTRWPPIWGASVPIIPTSGGISPSKGSIRRGWNCRRTCPTFRKSGLTSRFIWRGRRTSTHGSGCFSTISGGSGSMKIRSSFSLATTEDACPAARGSSMRPGPTCRSSSTCLRNGGIWPTVSPAGPTG